MRRVSSLGRVLVVDDDDVIRQLITVNLELEGFEVTTATDGQDCLDKVKSIDPAVITLDIMMPRLDGYQTCALIKKNAKFKSTPVIMLSSKDGLFDRARGRMVGSDQYLTKPFTKESLLKAVAAHVKAVAA